jgi:predicted nucleic acid-binding protein
LLRQGERRGRIPAANVAPTVARLLAIPCRVEPTPADAALGPILELAGTHALTSYDASYLWLAMSLGIGLATRDLPLAAAARAEGVALVAV